MNKLKKKITGVLALFCGAIAIAAQILFGAGSGYVAAANTYDEVVKTRESTLPRLAEANITTRHLLYKRGTGDTQVVVSGAADPPLGTIDNTGLAGEEMNVLLLGKGLTKKVVASEAIDVGEDVFTAANGKVQDRPAGAGTYWYLGIALSKTTADGQILELNDCVPVRLVVT